MLVAGATGEEPLVTGGADPVEVSAGTVTGAGVVLHATVKGLVCCCALSCLTTCGAGSKVLMGGVLLEIKNGRSEAVKVNGGSQAEPAPNWATKAETDAAVIVPPSGQ